MAWAGWPVVAGGQTLRAVCGLLAGVTVGVAAPSPDADPASPRAEWFRSLNQPGTGISCCSEADCREVEWRIARDHYEVFVDRATFGASAPEAWVAVPPNRVLLERQNPTGLAVVCWHGGFVLCFVKAVES